jgi:hypothetical protein
MPVVQEHLPAVGMTNFQFFWRNDAERGRDEEATRIFDSRIRIDCLR